MEEHLTHDHVMDRNSSPFRFALVTISEAAPRHHSNLTSTTQALQLAKSKICDYLLKAGVGAEEAGTGRAPAVEANRYRTF